MSARLPIVALAVVGVLACALPAPATMAADEAESLPHPPAVPGGDSGWFLPLPQDGPVLYRGMVNFDEAGMGSGAMLYPAPNIGGFLAAILTHGLLIESAKKGQKDALQVSADKVLLPYKDVLDKFNHRDLMERSLAKTSLGASGRLVDASGEPGSGTRVEIAPGFSLTQDQTAIVLDSAIVIAKPGTTSDTAYRNTIRVVSSGVSTGDPVVFWTANDGAKLKEESARLVAEALDLAFNDASAGIEKEPAPYRTVRYRQGSTEKMERAQVLSDRCGRLAIRTLRGFLMSVPASRTSAGAGTDTCGPGALVRSN
jgi:hypothetical protein